MHIEATNKDRQMEFRIALVLMAFLFFGCLEKHKEPDFREANWGITSDQVKMLEDAKLVMDNGKMLSYDGIVGGLPCQIVYLFVKDQLTNGHYFFKAEHTADSLHIHDYEKLKEVISKKYGRPLLDDATWKDDTYRGRGEKVGLAIKSGHLKLAAQWETPTTEVWLFLVGENSEIKLSMKYVSRLLGDIKEGEKKETQVDPKPNEF
jgi:hypothetical protein